MSEDTTFKAVLTAVRREWWLVLVAALVAVGVGYLGTSGLETRYEGRAVLVIDTPTISRYKGLPTPDDLIREASGAKLRKELADRSGVTPTELGAGLRLSTVGSPQSRMVVTFTSDDEARARSAASAVASGIAEHSRELASDEIDKQRAQIKLAEETIGALKEETEGAGLSAWERTDSAFKEWTVTSALIDARNVLRILEDVYSYDGEVTLAEVSAATQRRSTLVGALAVGLALGLGVSAAREAFIRRASG